MGRRITRLGLPALARLAIFLAFGAAQALPGAPATAEDTGWKDWIAARRRAYFQDTPRELEFLRSQRSGQGHARWLATGRLLAVLSDEFEPEAVGLAAEAVPELEQARRAADWSAALALQLGLARYAVADAHQAESKAMLDAAEVSVQNGHLAAGQAEIQAWRAGMAADEGDVAKAQALVNEVMSSDADDHLKIEMLVGPQLVARVINLRRGDNWKDVVDSIGKRMADPALKGEPYQIDALKLAQVTVMRRVGQKDEALTLLQQVIADRGLRHDGPSRPMRRLLIGLSQDRRDWPECVRQVSLLQPPPEVTIEKIDVLVKSIRCHAALHQAGPTQQALDEVQAVLPRFADLPAYVEVLHQTSARAYAELGDYQKAYQSMGLATEAGYKRAARANEAERQKLQTAFDVATKDRENQFLKARQDVLEQRRRELTLGLAAAALGLAVVGFLLRRQFVQRRRLATLSESLERVNRDLNALNASRTRLLAAACHDLRQPAHALGMLAELAAENMPSSDLVPIDAIRQCSLSLSDMLDMLLDMTQLESDKYRPQRSTIALEDLFAEMRAQFTPLAQRKGLRLEVLKTDAVVVCDRHLLRRMLLNLVSNAIKYTQEGSVTVDAQASDDQVDVAVTDTGPGIMLEKQQVIFKENVRLDEDAAVEGFGIGLPIVKRASELLGVPLRLESTPGVGTRVLLQLEKGRLASLKAVDESEVEGHGAVVGLVEDDDHIRMASERLLGAHGFRVVSAADADELCRGLPVDGQPPDVLITDLHLGSANGLEVIRALKNRPEWRSVPCILLTGDLDTDVAIKAALLGVFLAYKPVRPRRLLQLVSQVIAISEKSSGSGAGRAPTVNGQSGP